MAHCRQPTAATAARRIERAPARDCASSAQWRPEVPHSRPDIRDGRPAWGVRRVDLSSTTRSLPNSGGRAGSPDPSFSAQPTRSTADHRCGDAQPTVPWLRRTPVVVKQRFAACCHPQPERQGRRESGPGTAWRPDQAAVRRARDPDVGWDPHVVEVARWLATDLAFAAHRAWVASFGEHRVEVRSAALPCVRRGSLGPPTGGSCAMVGPCEPALRYPRSRCGSRPVMPLRRRLRRRCPRRARSPATARRCSIA
jgi:hypothetical protein